MWLKWLVPLESASWGLKYTFFPQWKKEYGIKTFLYLSLRSGLSMTVKDGDNYMAKILDKHPGSNSVFTNLKVV